MRWRLARSPWWVQGAVCGVLFGTGMTVFAIVQNGRWIPSLVGGAAGGALFGIAMGVLMSRMNRRLLGRLAEFSPPERAAILRASRGGPAPLEPALRTEARAMVERQRDVLRRQRPLSLVVFGVGVVGYVALALTGSPWWWLAAVGFLGFIVLTEVTLRRLDRRLDRLPAG